MVTLLPTIRCYLAQHTSFDPHTSAPLSFICITYYILNILYVTVFPTSITQSVHPGNGPFLWWFSQKSLVALITCFFLSVKVFEDTFVLILGYTNKIELLQHYKCIMQKCPTESQRVRYIHCQFLFGLQIKSCCPKVLP